nr:hypothetical protein HmN_000979500 [Hymenolepis microstoma]CUU98117.1 hypothetical transcript [Hymenolepis microstoma]
MFFKPTDQILRSTIKHQDLDRAESIEPNCQRSSTMVNPVKEFNTELLSNDISELFKELPDLVKDSISIRGDIHNFLLDHSPT